MKRKAMIFSMIIAMIAIVVTIVGYSIAWYSVNSEVDKSLDYIIYSRTLVSFEISQADFFAKITPAVAVEGAVATGQDVSGVFSATGNIETRASLGVSKLQLQYYGDSGTGSMEISCGAYSSFGGVNYDVGDDVSYIVCAKGTGLSIDGRWFVSQLPQTDRWIANEGGTGYVQYSFGANDQYYLLTSNLRHDELYSYFGINNYLTVCTYDSSSGNYADWWEKIPEYRTDDAFKAAVTGAISDGKTQFTFNGFWYDLQESEGVYTVLCEDQVGAIATSSEMNMEFLIMIWYNKVDELLDPVISEGTMRVSITVDTEGD